MKPYAFRGLSREERIFNYRLSRARRVVENVFGILASRFRVLLTTMNLSPKVVQKIVLACCTLHNFLREKKSANYAAQGFLGEIMPDGEVREGSWRQERCNLTTLGPQPGNFYAHDVKDTRDQFKTYFNDAGAVSWQGNIV